MRSVVSTCVRFGGRLDASVRRTTNDADSHRNVDDGDATGDDDVGRRADGGGNGVGVRPGGSEPV